MKTLSDAVKPQDSHEFNLDKCLTIREALRIMIDNRKYSATVIDGDGGTIGSVNVKGLREAISLGYSSSSSLEQLLWGILISDIFFNKAKVIEKGTI